MAKKVTKKVIKKKVAKKLTKKVAKKVATKKNSKKVTKKVIKKKVTKKVTKKVIKKKVSKKVTKKVVKKKVAKKVTKKVTKKKAAKKVTKKAVKKITSKKVTKKSTQTIKSTKEEAQTIVLDTKETTSNNDKEVPFNKEAKPEEILLENLEEESEGNADSKDKPDPLLESEYNPDDEQDNGVEGSYGYGWGYNDAFDNPDEEKEVSLSEMDEDEIYAKGLDKKKEQENL